MFPYEAKEIHDYLNTRKAFDKEKLAYSRLPKFIVLF